MKKLAALVETEECDAETDKIESVSENKTVKVIKKSRMQSIYWCKYFISLCFNNINWNNDLFLFKIKK